MYDRLMMPATTVPEKLPKTPSPGGKITKVRTFAEDDSDDDEATTTHHSESDQEAEPEMETKENSINNNEEDGPVSSPPKNSAKRKDSTHLFIAGQDKPAPDSDSSSNTKKKKGKGRDLSEKYNTSYAARNEKKSAWQSMKSMGTDVKRDFRTFAKKLNPKRKRNEVKEISITQDRHEDVDVCWSEKSEKCANEDLTKDITPTSSARSRASNDITVVHDLEDDDIY